MWRTAGSMVVTALVVLCVWTAYANVFADDTAVRTQAEKIAREKAGCADKCKLARMDGSRGILTETIAYTFQDVGVVTVTCRRPYVSFGAYACDATKP